MGTGASRTNVTKRCDAALPQCPVCTRDSKRPLEGPGPLSLCPAVSLSGLREGHSLGAGIYTCGFTEPSCHPAAAWRGLRPRGAGAWAEGWPPWEPLPVSAEEEPTAVGPQRGICCREHRPRGTRTLSSNQGPARAAGRGRLLGGEFGEVEGKAALAGLSTGGCAVPGLQEKTKPSSPPAAVSQPGSGGGRTPASPQPAQRARPCPCTQPRGRAAASMAGTPGRCEALTK